MRNLKNIRRSITSLPSTLPLNAVSWDGQDLICAQGPFDGEVEINRIDSSNQVSSIASFQIEKIDDEIVNIQYFADTGTTSIILKSGDIILAKDDGITIVGSVDAGITAAAWSPDEELIAIVTGADTLLFMTRDFDNVADIIFSPNDIKASNHVSVGWGKRETQFQGKRAKALRDPTMPEKVDEGLLTEIDSRDVTISWRGDGAYVAVNSVTSIENKERRMIRVFSREGILDSVSEPLDFLEGSLSWRPAGNIIAAIQRLQDQVKVVFFERNGLRHGQFDLRLSAEDLRTWASHTIELKWNIDSTVLAVCFRDRVQLWTMNNYHYYLKHEINNLETAHSRSVICWHPESALQLSIIVREGLVQRSEFVLDVATGPTAPPNDAGLVAVIDGRTIKITPLRTANVPPPMSLQEIHLDFPAVDVVVSEAGDKIIVLTNQSLSLYMYDTNNKSTPPPAHQASFPMQHNGIFPRRLWLNGGIAMVVCDGYDTDPFVVDPSTEATTLDIKHPSEFLASELKATTHPWTRTCEVNKATITFGLTRGGKLVAERRTLATNCTSFVTTEAHLIFTTTQHLLKFVHLDSVEALEVPADEPEKDERCRSIERGARLVTAIPSIYAVILQMPRGNLETIYPRAMVVAGIRRNIEAKQYKKAFLTCRNQRVDMNILHDHAPQQFLANVDEFIKQLKKVEYIDLFLSTLKEENVSQTMYRETLEGSQTGEQALSRIDILSRGSKVNRICDAFLNTLKTKTSTNLQNIITANVCKSPPDLDAGLLVVASLREESEEVAERAAEHICFLADVNELYNHALGLYDIELAILIAQQSQKDPREYLPYLQSLQEMKSLRRQFTIDQDLGRHDKALKHLYELDAFEELKIFTRKQSLYAAALDLYRYQESQLRELMLLQAEYLSQNHKHREAGVAYEFLGDYNLALNAYRAANMWQEALSSACLIPLPESELRELALSLADTLAETRQFFEAATIHIEHLKDIETATKLLCKGYHFASAIRLISLRGQTSLLTDIVDPGLVDGSATITELLADMKVQLNAQIPRLRELRQKKSADPFAFYAGGEEGGGDIPDNISLAPTDASTSGGTFMTQYTRRTDGTVASNATRKTSKNRRREERKRARGKKGSVYEEEYLVSSIERLIERANSVNEEVARLLEGLMRRSMRERAIAVQAAMQAVLEACNTCIPEVFGAETAEQQDRGLEEVANGESARPGRGQGVLWDAVEESKKKRDPPVLKRFSGLSLLGQ